MLIREIYNSSANEKKPKDKFKEQHPNYRSFEVDPLAPLTKKKKKITALKITLKL
jgi:hypothetical protein